MGESREHSLGDRLDKQQLVGWEYECISVCEQNTQICLFWGAACLKSENIKREVNDEFA